MFERGLTEQYTYNQYVRTARRLQGTKYGVYVAKDDKCYNYYRDNFGNDDDSDQVLGMVEVGMTRINIDALDLEQEETPMIVPMLGVLCVREDFRRDGVGSALISECESLIRNVWLRRRNNTAPCSSNNSADDDGDGDDVFSESNNKMENECYLYVQVEPNNLAALKLFAKSGFHDTGYIVNATVARRRQLEERPHRLLKKDILLRHSVLNDMNC